MIMKRYRDVNFISGLINVKLNNFWENVDVHRLVKLKNEQY